MDCDGQKSNARIQLICGMIFGRVLSLAAFVNKADNAVAEHPRLLYSMGSCSDVS
jgi:hypothetical protein